jgi:hypothetical protein
MNVQMRVHVLRTFVTHLLVHIHQKEKIALAIAAKIASVNQWCKRALEVLTCCHIFGTVSLHQWMIPATDKILIETIKKNETITIAGKSILK